MKKLIFITTILAISLSSCLKDEKHYVDFANAGNIVNMPQSGLTNFGSDAITAPDTVVTEFAVDYATAKANGALSVTLAVDPTYMDKYNAANPAIAYEIIPANAYVLNTKVDIAAGAQYAFTTLTVYRNLLDPSKSYMLPVVIKDAGGIPISGNMNVHYYHIIGNDFAGAYTWDYRRWSNGTGPGTGTPPEDPDITGLGRAGTINPVSPTEFQMLTGYNTNQVLYDVKFTRTVTGTTINYSDWVVTMDPETVAAIWTAGLVQLRQAPIFVTPPPATGTDPKIFHMQFVAGSAGSRWIEDTYHK
ncbi:MAG TPA: DUF1735 domain-containing protein [Mucilaginibacter sp.]|nr:DUF1735 domain-containing protein [Mucilaginibacter sp.]